MAAPKMKDAWSRRAVLAGFTAASLVAAVPAAAQNATTTPAATYQQELDQMSAASDAARDYATNNYGVGIVIHVGQDILGNADGDKIFQRMTNFYQSEFAKRGIDSQVFPRSNSDAPATVLTYHIDEYIHGMDNGTALKGPKQAFEAIPDVIAMLKVSKEVALNQSEPSTPGGG